MRMTSALKSALGRPRMRIRKPSELALIVNVKAVAHNSRLRLMAVEGSTSVLPGHLLPEQPAHSSSEVTPVSDL
jgi:hypothetical protein